MRRLRLSKLQKSKIELDYQAYLAKVKVLNKKKQFLKTYSNLMNINDKKQLIDTIFNKQAKLNLREKELFK